MRLWSCHCLLFESTNTWLSCKDTNKIQKHELDLPSVGCPKGLQSTFLGAWQSYCHMLVQAIFARSNWPWVRKKTLRGYTVILCFHLTLQTQKASQSLICLRPPHPPRLHWPVSIWSRVYRRRDRCHPSHHHPWTAGRLLDCQWPELKVRRTLGDLTLSISFISSPVI